MLFVGCPVPTHFEGTWRQSPQDGQTQPLRVADNASRFIELRLGHYGPQLAGVVHFFESFQGIADQQCPCAVVGDGKFLNGQLSFTFSYCNQRKFAAVFTENDDRIMGTITEVNPSTPTSTNQATLELNRIADEVPQDQRHCETTANP